MQKLVYIALGTALIAASCNKQTTSTIKGLQEAKDNQTFADLDKARIKHLSLDIETDFKTHQIKGSASYQFKNNNSKKIILDTEELTIDSVLLANNKKTTFKLGNRDAVKGRALEIDITPKDTVVTVYYKTTSDANALQWLSPEQTHDKKQPFLLSQGQAILTRSWIPIQDTPSVRITYDAKIKTPKDLMALMSAINPKEKSKDGIYTFKMPQPIAPYLVALAVGDVNYQAIDNRTGIYAEPNLLKDAVWEFADMGKMVTTAEKLYGKYPWEQFDVLVLPPSFPFGGMENPRLTFATPTAIVGDRSMTNLVAHELAHSWSGNLVTNSTWDDFWINEGFTVYFERRIMEELEGKDYADMISVIGFQDLETSMRNIPKEYTSLKVNMKGKNPDDAFSDVPYDKGYLFLKMLEDKYGREKFDIFLNNYFSSHAFQTMTTEKFIDYLKQNLTNNDDSFVQEWIYTTGWPKGVQKPTSKLFDLAENQLQQDIKNSRNKVSPEKIAISTKSTNEWLHYIRQIDVDKNTKEDLAYLDEIYDFTDSKNPEIECAWFEKAFLLHYDKVNKNAKEFLVNVGRRKFLEPLYLALKESKQFDLANDIYKSARPNYHFVAKQTIDGMLNYKP
ncbi:M1 family metallopeptidase [Chishuiella sp.]|uniref:M1 family metallopeptidase n=1 Tax=Chishuiella sp. TaxID=1969467 RepID=UPI0028AF9630|nr:M1 family metallopeptidase [Chishuiella sp.]